MPWDNYRETYLDWGQLARNKDLEGTDSMFGFCWLDACKERDSWRSLVD
jgi:hypothetical protein